MTSSLLAGALRGLRGGGRTATLAAAASAAAAALAAGGACAWPSAAAAEAPPSQQRAPGDASALPSASSSAPPSAGPAPAPRLPVDKLCCRAAPAPPRQPQPLVLVACGSFNPPTLMHLRMAELAADELLRRGYDVWGAYLSPVADSYGKPGLAPAADRVAMCRLAADPTPSLSGSAWRSHDSRAQTQAIQDPEPDLVMVYDWEARQPGYTRSLAVLRRVESELSEWLQGGSRSGSGSGPDPSAPSTTSSSSSPDSIALSTAPPTSPPLPPSTSTSAPAPALPSSPPQPHPHSGQPQPQREVRAMLLCGADVLASMAVPGVWRDPDVILRDHGVACVAREGSDLQALLDTPGTVLYDYRDRIVLVYDRVGNSISSSRVRAELAAGRPVRHLVPAGALSYIYERGLYGARRRGLFDPQEPRDD
ncbi:hypothetical protein HYH03_011749 [Edaphochlamys debaryana]|uniref:Cytidyltransferase-like domain-containing protein n=1 Tax=Edaphochlamys debaryana TaxID=47281 RepID=A0A835XZK6_9CHLO|nr:hypothetical protein HYH03_011749 [Edaphochlamys debaryana]|eukprot:KAG2489800.1 hypothetical protein HYH03_011749 [Edaphochlamys debaryana]